MIDPYYMTQEERREFAVKLLKSALESGNQELVDLLIINIAVIDRHVDIDDMFEIQANFSSAVSGSQPKGNQ